MELYRVILEVEPTPEHPSFYEYEGGFLHVWIFGNDPDDAASRAASVLEQLPYELCKTQVEVRKDKPPLHPVIAANEANARAIGLSMYLAAVRTGGVWKET